VTVCRPGLPSSLGGTLGSRLGANSRVRRVADSLRGLWAGSLGNILRGNLLGVFPFLLVGLGVWVLAGFRAHGLRVAPGLDWLGVADRGVGLVRNLDLLCLDVGLRLLVRLGDCKSFINIIKTTTEGI
jgi:hypothetical protein